MEVQEQFIVAEWGHCDTHLREIIQILETGDRERGRRWEEEEEEEQEQEQEECEL